MNKKIGNDFEQELCTLLANKGFWAHNLANRKNGQPADIIAVQGRVAFLIDAKVCTNDTFQCRRVEANQAYAMKLWLDCKNTSPYFALKTSAGIYMISYEMMCDIMRDGVATLALEDIQLFGYELATWIKIVKSSI